MAEPEYSSLIVCVRGTEYGSLVDGLGGCTWDVEETFECLQLYFFHWMYFWSEKTREAERRKCDYGTPSGFLKSTFSALPKMKQSTKTY